jgi:carboxymethylenebutenolidase
VRVTLPSGTPAVLVHPPAGTAPRRGLVIAPDIMGLRPLFDDMAARLAREHGWVVCVVEPFPGQEALPLDERLESAVSAKTDERSVGDLVAGADACDLEPVAVIGFCMGGMYTLKAAGTGRFDRCAAFYGMIHVPDDWRGPGQGDPLHAVRSRPAGTEVLAVVGTADPYTPSDDVAELEAAGVTVVRYEGAEHGFVHDPSRPAHRADDAADAWRRVIDFLT